jgi:nucleotide-binding universal stress UspA family protein
MNARGSTEVIVATIGLSTGALSQDLFTMILAMAVVTTMAMPPMLRWAVARVPPRPEEAERLAREEFEAKGFVTTMERLLVAADERANGRFASRLAGLIAGSRRIPTTILRTSPDNPAGQRRSRRVEAVAKATAAAAAQPDRPEPDAAPAAVITTRPRATPVEGAVAAEARKGYDFLVIGLDPVVENGILDERLARIAAEFDGPFAIADARGVHRRDGFVKPLDILVPVTGTGFSRRGAEVALALARADHGSVTALYVSTPANRPWRRRLHTAWAIGADEESILREIVALGDLAGVTVRTAVRTNTTADEAILRRLRGGGHNLVVMGVSQRPGATLSFGAVPTAVLARSERSILLVAS